MATEVLLPRLGWNMEEGTFIEWLKKDGDPVKPGDVLYTVESDKALNEVEAFDEGILRIPPDSPAPGSKVPVGALLAFIVQPGEDLKPVSNLQSPIPTISPRARRVANELAVDWMQLQGSGRTGRIVERDVRAAATAQQATATPQGLVVKETKAARRPFSSVRRVIADRMSTSAHTTAPVTLTAEVDATELVRLREQLKADFPSSLKGEGSEVKVSQPIPSFTDLLAKISSHALQEHPALNARLEGDEIITESSVHIGIAVDSDRGLLIVVVRDAQDKTLRQITAESQQLIARAREGKATSDDMRGSTFTITNLGMYDIDAFTPIINLPECAILGMGRVAPKQVVIDDTDRVAVRRMMTLSLTFDHRLVDGAPAARFLQRVKQLVEQPYLWLVN